MIRALLPAAFGLAAAAQDHWAVLVAGSNGWWNYRHQADVCHAYQVLIKRGFHPDKIITMMYDDVANSAENPFPGKLYNHPSATAEEAVDVYAGCKLDYTGKKVTPTNFVAVLTGDAAKAGGKVLRSTAEDHVFVNFVDHGGVGLIAFPDKVMHAHELISTLESMHEKGMYKQLTFYLETCESGSMFSKLLPETLPVYAVTAANPTESSWGTYCGTEANVAGKNIGTCLGDLFSVNWMADSEAHPDDEETLAQQFTRVKKLTTKSHVMSFGQVAAIGAEAVAEFQGPGAGLGSRAPETPPAGSVDARNVKLEHLYRRFASTGSVEAGDQLVQEILAKQGVTALGDSIVREVVGGLVGGSPHQDWTTCHEGAVQGFGDTCGWTEGRLVLSKTLYQLCGETSGNPAPILAALQKVCPPVALAV